MVLVIDNYDSFTYNLVQYLAELGAQVDVARNDEVTVDGVRRRRPGGIVISPGPGRPADAGVSMDVIRQLGGHVPILGVCLGHQCIGEVFGGTIIRARRLMHGKTSMVRHNRRDLFDGIPNPFEATRYHSLVVRRDDVPTVLQVTAWTDRREVMGVRHKTLPIWGVQFHPESILTTPGHAILANFLRLASARRLRRGGRTRTRRR